VPFPPYALVAPIVLAAAPAHAADPAPTSVSPAAAVAGTPDQPATNTPAPARSAAPAAPKPAQFIPGGRPGAPGAIQPMRWAEDWSKAPSAGAPLLARLKHLPLGNDAVWLSLGGGARAYYTDWSHTTVGLRGGDRDNLVQTRLRLHADLHLGSQVRAFVELGDNREHGAEFKTGPNVNHFDIQQAFVDVTVPLGAAGKITFRPGRYEMPLGNGKLVGVREGLNMRFSYQGYRATWILPGKVSVDAFSLHPVNIKNTGNFDDGPNHTQDFQGVYISAPSVLAGFGADAYFYEFDKTSATLRLGTGADHRQNWGLRVNRKTAQIDFDLEGNMQRGHFAGQPIRAWAAMLEIGYTDADMPLTPRLGLRANVFSGDGNLADGTAGTFVAAAPRLPLISEAAWFNTSNLMDLYPSVTLKPAKSVSIMAGPDFLWRNTSADGVYVGPAGSSIAPYAGSRAIGTDYNLEASWQATRNLSLRLFETWFAASDSLKAHGGINSNYFGLLGELRF